MTGNSNLASSSNSNLDGSSRPNTKVHIEGLGLIGASIALKLGILGYEVSGHDLDSEVTQRALDRGVIHSQELAADTELVFVAVPVESSLAVIESCLAASKAIVTDVGSTKADIVKLVTSDRFIGGHPMAGSAVAGLDGADSNLFIDSTWVLTPTPETSADIELQVRDVVNDLGAQAISIDAVEHDRLVATISHVPHLVSASLMNLATDSASENDLALRLAAGGFRDMTRISGGSAAIWPDICMTNASQISQGLENLASELTQIAGLIKTKNRAELSEKLNSARTARQNLPARYAQVSQVTEVQVQIGDSPGQLSQVTKIAAEVGVNIVDIGIEHLSSGDSGILMLLVDENQVGEIRHALSVAGFEVRVDGFKGNNHD